MTYKNNNVENIALFFLGEQTVKPRVASKECFEKTIVFLDFVFLYGLCFFGLLFVCCSCKSGGIYNGILLKRALYKEDRGRSCWHETDKFWKKT